MGTFFLNGLLFASQPQEKGWLEKVDLQLTQPPPASTALEMMKDATGKKLIEKSVSFFWDKAQEKIQSGYYNNSNWANPGIRAALYRFLYELVRAPQQDQENAATLLGSYLELNRKKSDYNYLSARLLHVAFEEVNIFWVNKLLNSYIDKEGIESAGLDGEWICANCKCASELNINQRQYPLVVLGIKPEGVQVKEIFELLLKKKFRFDRSFLRGKTSCIQPWAKAIYNKYLADERASKLVDYEKELKEQNPEFPQEANIPPVLSASIGAAPGVGPASDASAHDFKGQK